MAVKRGKIAHFAHFVHLEKLWLQLVIIALTQVTLKSAKIYSGFSDIPCHPSKRIWVIE